MQPRAMSSQYPAAPLTVHAWPSSGPEPRVLQWLKLLDCAGSTWVCLQLPATAWLACADGAAAIPSTTSVAKETEDARIPRDMAAPFLRVRSLPSVCHRKHYQRLPLGG